jgi:hypothetical protein
MAAKSVTEKTTEGMENAGCKARNLYSSIFQIAPNKIENINDLLLNQ